MNLLHFLLIFEYIIKQMNFGNYDKKAVEPHKQII